MAISLFVRVDIEINFGGALEVDAGGFDVGGHFGDEGFADFDDFDGCPVGQQIVSHDQVKISAWADTSGAGRRRLPINMIVASNRSPLFCSCAVSCS